MDLDRPIRMLLIACLVGAIATSVASPALSRSLAPCPRFDPVQPNSESQQTDKVPDGGVSQIEGGKPDAVVHDFEVGTNIWVPSGLFTNRPLVEDTHFLNLQVTGGSGETTLNTKLTWDSPRQMADLDLIIYDAQGIELQRSEYPMGQPESMEFVSVPARRCEGFTVEVRALRALEARGTLEIWLSRDR